MLNWALRYAPVVDFINRNTPMTILEVGSGCQGLAHYVKHKIVVGTDIQFKYTTAPNLLPLVATALQLPFRDNSFDLVVSSDMMEHLPEEIRVNAAREMLRCAKKHLIIGFPSGITAEQTDRDIAAELERRKKPIPDWLSEHFLYPYPTSQSILGALSDLPDISIKLIRNTSCVLHKKVIVGETRRFISRLLARLDSIVLVQFLSNYLHRGNTYREIIFIEKSSTVCDAPT